MVVYWSVPSMYGMCTWQLLSFSSCCSWVDATWIAWLVVSTAPKHKWNRQPKMPCEISIVPPPAPGKNDGWNMLKTDIDPRCVCVCPFVHQVKQEQKKDPYWKSMKHHKFRHVVSNYFPKTLFGLCSCIMLHLPWTIIPRTPGNMFDERWLKPTTRLNSALRKKKQVDCPEARIRAPTPWIMWGTIVQHGGK